MCHPFGFFFKGPTNLKEINVSGPSLSLYHSIFVFFIVSLPLSLSLPSFLSLLLLWAHRYTSLRERVRQEVVL